MGRFDRQIATAKRQVAQNGQKVTWRQFTAGAAPDPNKPWVQGADTYVDREVTIVFLNVNRTDERLMQYLKGTELATGFLRGLMADEGFTPTLKDVVIRDNETYSLKNIDTVSPNGQVILHKLEFNRAA